MKKTGIAAAALVAAVLLAWLGVFLYWHFTLRSAIHYFEDHASDVPRPWDPLSDSEAFNTVRGSGCRSLPYLVSAIAGSRDPELQRGLSVLVFFAATKTDTPEAAEKLQKVTLLSVDDTPPEHRKKCDDLRAWWAQDGSLYHQWWRVWSSKCGPSEEK